MAQLLPAKDDFRCTLDVNAVASGAMLDHGGHRFAGGVEGVYLDQVLFGNSKMVSLPWQ